MISSTEPVVIMSRAELDALIERTARAAADEAVRRIQPVAANELWDALAVGTYLGISDVTVSGKLAYQRGFPAAITLGDGPKARRRWLADEIKEWAARRQQRRAS